MRDVSLNDAVNDAALPSLVSTAWLAAHIDAPDVRVVDATWFLPTDPRDARALYDEGHIPGAVFFDVDAIADRSTDLPHMLPDAETFAAAVGALGIGDGDRVVCYDAHGVYSAPRVWWTFRAFGHRAVTVLDGGLPRWRAEGRPVVAGVERPAPARFHARLDPAFVTAVEDVRRNIETRRSLLVDVRPAGRFRGDEPEPRPGLRSGHVPGSRNVPWPSLLTSDGASLRPPDELRAVLGAAGVDPSRPVISTCGSGLTAAIMVFALHRLDESETRSGAAPPGDVALYDGSWAEWGALPGAPTATGPAGSPAAGDIVMPKSRT